MGGHVNHSGEENPVTNFIADCFLLVRLLLSLSPPVHDRHLGSLANYVQLMWSLPLPVSQSNNNKYIFHKALDAYFLAVNKQGICYRLNCVPPIFSPNSQWD